MKAEQIILLSLHILSVRFNYPHKIFIKDEIEMLRTKLTDASDPDKNEDIGSDQDLDSLEAQMPQLESARRLSRDSSEATVSSVAHILGSVQVVH